MDVCVHEPRRNATCFNMRLPRRIAELAYAAVLDNDVDVAPGRVQRAVVKDARTDDHYAGTFARSSA